MIAAAHELTLGGLDLLGRDVAEDFTVKAIGEGTDWGSPEPIEVAIRSLLQDGSLVSTLGHDNRTATIMVSVEAADSTGLAQGEAALFAELGKRNTLSWTPPDGWGPTSVFEVVTSSLVHTFDDLGELMGRRGYAVRLVCEPFARSVDLVTASALAAPVDGGGTPVAPVLIQIDDGSSTTRWSSTTGPVSTSGTYVAAESQPGALQVHIAKSWPGSGVIDTSVADILVVDWYIVSSAPSKNLSVRGATGGYLKLIAYGASPIESGFTRSFFQVVGDTIGTVNFYGDVNWQSGTPGPNGPRLRIANLLFMNQPPAIGTGRQKFFSVDVAGSARTQGALEVSHPTNALGETLVYTWPNQPGSAAYSPPLRQFLADSGLVAADAGLVSGGSNNTDIVIAYNVPATQLPDGSYLLMARVKSDTVGAFALNWAAYTVFGPTLVGDAVHGSRVVTFAMAGVWQYVALGRAVLPTVRVSTQSTAEVQVTIGSGDTGAATVELDEAWLFNTTIGDLTIVDCGTGTPAAGLPSNRLWIDTASTDSPLPAIFCGSLEDRTDQFHAGSRVTSWGRHEFAPPGMNVFVVTPGALDASVSLSHYPRWHTHAAQ